jgi:hypothetical protein
MAKMHRTARQLTRSLVSRNVIVRVQVTAHRKVPNPELLKLCSCGDAGGLQPGLADRLSGAYE